MDNIDISFGDDVLLSHGNGVTIDDYNDNVISSETVVGPPGPPGPAGYSPTANVTQTEDGAIIRITDESGTTTANVYNGADGVSPTATVTGTASGATITITDANGTTTASVNNGEDGNPGDNATIAVGQVTTLAPGSQATVSNVGTATNAVLDFGIPEGLQGDQGIQGNPGINARAYVTQNTGSATITIEDYEGTTTATVYDGADGQPGTPGFSPSASVTQTASGATISITDEQGTTTANITNGVDGTDGTDGVTPVITATASVDSTTGTPSVAVSKSGTDANPQFAFAFSHLKGETGSQGPAGDTNTIKAGTVTIPALSSGGYTYIPVTIPTQSSTNYSAVVTLSGSTSFWTWLRFAIANKTTTGFDINVLNDGGGGTGSVDLDYIVVKHF